MAANEKWPNPKKDTIVYVVNPIEADLPSHWVPISIIKKHLEIKLGLNSTKTSNKNLNTRKLNLKFHVKVTSAVALKSEYYDAESDNDGRQEIHKAEKKAANVLHTIKEPELSKKTVVVNIKASNKAHSDATAKYLTVTHELLNVPNGGVTRGANTAVSLGPTAGETSMTTARVTPGPTARVSPGPTAAETVGMISVTTVVPTQPPAPTILPTTSKLTTTASTTPESTGDPFY